MKSWEQLKAEDVMSSPVIALNVDATLEEAAKRLTEEEISGALVTDRGVPVGVISLFDIVTFLAGHHRPAGEPGGFYRFSYPTIAQGEGRDSADEEEPAEESPGELTVGELMATEIITVAPRLPLADVAKVLAGSHIHRVFVAADRGPVGVISTMDVLSALAGMKGPEDLPIRNRRKASAK